MSRDVQVLLIVLAGLTFFVIGVAAGFSINNLSHQTYGYDCSNQVSCEREAR